MLLTANTLPRNTLQWIDGKLVAEASDIPGFHLARLWDDACDVGVILNNRAGVPVPFVLTKVEENADDEVVAWHFVSHKCAALPVPVHMVIFND